MENICLQNIQYTRTAVVFFFMFFLLNEKGLAKERYKRCEITEGLDLWNPNALFVLNILWPLWMHAEAT